MKTVIVTGVSGGLGQQIVTELLADTGYGVVGIGREAPAKLADKRFRFVRFDLQNCEGIADLYKNELHKETIWGLVNNAAAAYDDLVTNAQLDPLLAMYRTNVLAPILLSKYAIRNMLLQDTRGSLVHISSLSVHTGFKGLAMYGSTKGALEAFSLGVAREYGARGIRSNCVAPGFMKTRMTSKLDDQQLSQVTRRSCLQTETDPASVAKAVAFLLSPASASMTGTTMRLDAGAL
jgi:3-oxoacyl-[acyl-carrier protein] reductase